MGNHPYKRQRGSYRVDLLMPRLPAGRLQKSSGLYEKKAVTQLKVALKSLYSRGYDHLLLDWKNDKLSALSLIHISEPTRPY